MAWESGPIKKSRFSLQLFFRDNEGTVQNNYFDLCSIPGEYLLRHVKFSLDSALR